jgi:16S rRNA (guanine1516-N2)-methyltransferase
MAIYKVKTQLIASHAILINENEKLKIIAEDDLAAYNKGKKIKSLCVDFLDPKIKKRIKTTGKNSLLAKAVGIVSKKVLQEKPLKIIDATAGLGIDAFILAVLGCDVLMLERSPIIGELLKNGLSLATNIAEFADLKLELKIIDAKSYLQKLASKVDVIFLDPMYPLRTKSALNKKEMRLLKDIVGEDADFAELLKIALNKAKRIVIKRPKFANVLMIDGREPNLIFKGQSIFYEVFLN